jgi:hypothetical protein
LQQHPVAAEDLQGGSKCQGFSEFERQAARRSWEGSAESSSQAYVRRSSL